MLKYLLVPLPAILAALAGLIPAVTSGALSGARSWVAVHNAVVFANFWFHVGLIMSLLWLLGCVVYDVFRWIDRRHYRRFLREEQRRRQTVAGTSQT